jgi:hypothetical protein
MAGKRKGGRGTRENITGGENEDSVQVCGFIGAKV